MNIYVYGEDVICYIRNKAMDLKETSRYVSSLGGPFLKPKVII